MAYGTRIIKDSLGPSGKRLTTFELTYPRFVHAELMTHRLFSRNSSSSRAIPIEKMMARVREDPAMPKFWGKNQKGMQAIEELGEYEKRDAFGVWLAARDEMLDRVQELCDLGVHKQLANRLLEPWMFITVLVSATEYDNWFHLRRDAAAQPEIKWVADDMYQHYVMSEPIKLLEGEWHLPLIDLDTRDELRSTLAIHMFDELMTELLIKISVGRCARVSYLTHEGKRDVREDISLHDRLMTSGHWSPFEHVAQALATPERSGNFSGWKQYRKQFATEHHGAVIP